MAFFQLGHGRELYTVCVTYNIHKITKADLINESYNFCNNYKYNDLFSEKFRSGLELFAAHYNHHLTNTIFIRSIISCNDDNSERT